MESSLPLRLGIAEKARSMTEKRTPLRYREYTPLSTLPPPPIPRPALEPTA